MLLCYAANLFKGSTASIYPSHQLFDSWQKNREPVSGSGLNRSSSVVFIRMYEKGLLSFCDVACQSPQPSYCSYYVLYLWADWILNLKQIGNCPSNRNRCHCHNGSSGGTKTDTAFYSPLYPWVSSWHMWSRLRQCSSCWLPRPN